MTTNLSKKPKSQPPQLKPDSGRFGFLFGNYPDLSLAELNAVFSRLQLPSRISLAAPNLALVADKISPAQILPLLGGCVKAGPVWIGSPSQLLPVLLADLRFRQPHHVCFSGSPVVLSLPEVAKTLKRQLGSAYNLHFRLASKASETAGIGPHWTDYAILDAPFGQIAVVFTLAVQDIAWWSKKDFGKPYANPKAGLLPPKIARILVNLSLPALTPDKVSFLDPFCGSGTLGIEALDLGIGRVTLTDINSEQVNFARANLNWFHQLKPSPATVQIDQVDVMRYPQAASNRRYDAIAFEGYLGPARLEPEASKNQLKGLLKFYTGVFKRLHPLLNPGGKLTAALPAYVLPSGKLLTLSPLIDTCEKLGYTLIGPNMIIGRPQAQIKREIYSFTKLAD